MSRTVFAVLSFEGPDKYSRVGGLATRVAGLAVELARMGHETHLFFIGDPYLPGHEVQENGLLHLRRWCQWISRNHPGGAYDGEAGKLWDWNRSIPSYFLQTFIPESLQGDTQVVVLAEEWQTTDSVVAIHEGLMKLPSRSRVMLVWNANNTYGFDRVRWSALKEAATITTVSRYMKYLMQAAGISARAVPNGIDETWLEPLDAAAVQPLAAAVRGKMTITKVARWDAEKRWDYAVDSVALMKDMGMSPLFLARGGAPERGTEVTRRMTEKGLTFEKVHWDSSDTVSLTKAVLPSVGADVVLLESMLQEQQLKLLYRVSDAVLANSAVEPFGLVGLETMAAGGIAAVGATGEDYATNGYDAISLQTDDVREFVRYVARLKNYGGAQRAMRSEARKSAARYTWRAVIDRALFPFIREVGFEVGDDPAGAPVVSDVPKVNGTVSTNGLAATAPG